MKIYLFLLFSFFGISACQPTAEPIEYGADLCDFCKMTIVDRQHAAEAVSPKGKVFKFDAIECMVGYIQQKEATAFPLLLVNDYESPGTLTDARAASYLISQNLPSPMGAFLTGFALQSAATRMKAAKGGQLFDWDQLNTHLGAQKQTWQH